MDIFTKDTTCNNDFDRLNTSFSRWLSQDISHPTVEKIRSVGNSNPWRGRDVLYLIGDRRYRAKSKVQRIAGDYSDEHKTRIHNSYAVSLACDGFLFDDFDKSEYFTTEVTLKDKYKDKLSPIFKFAREWLGLSEEDELFFRSTYIFQTLTLEFWAKQEQSPTVGLTIRFKPKFPEEDMRALPRGKTRLNSSGQLVWEK